MPIMPKFKIGDRVIVSNVSDKRTWIKPLEGATGTVKKIFKCANPDVGCYDIGLDYIISESELELDGYKFKVGDKVKIVRTNKMSGSHFIGDVVTIRDLTHTSITNAPCYRVTGDAGKTYLWFNDELELVKPKFDHKNYPGKYVMHVNTEEQAKIFVDYMRNIMGLSWIFNCFDVHKTNTAYNFNKDYYSSISNYSEKGYTILEFEDFDWSDFTMKKEFTKKDLKNGDVVKRRDGLVEILVSDLNVFVGDHGDYAELRCINDDLTSNCNTNRDIIAVRRINCNYGNPFQTFQHEYGTLVYERKEVEEMTLEEVCKALGKEIKIVKK